jgi:hypothetical protein
MKFSILFCFIFLFTVAIAQRTDSSVIKKDSLATQKKIKKLAYQDSFPNPRKALLYAIIPGGGQIYNRKLWYIKLPIVYGALAFGIYQIRDNSIHYNNLNLNYHNSVNKLPLDNTLYPNISNYTQDAIKQNRDLYYKSLQESYIFTTIGYLLTGLEAYTAAHLAHFDVKNDIGFKIKPSIESIPLLGQASGIGVQFTF